MSNVINSDGSINEKVIKEAAKVVSIRIGEMMGYKKEQVEKLFELKHGDNVAVVNAIYKEGVEGSQIKVGMLLLVRYFDGDMSKALSKDPNKNESFARFSANTNLKVSRTTLARWVQAAAVYKECDKKKIKVEKLSVSQLAAIAKLDDHDERINLADKVASVDMSVKEIIEEVKALRKENSPQNAVIIDKDKINLSSIKKYLSKPEEATANEEFMELLQDPDFMGSTFKRKERLEIYELLEKAAESKEGQLKKIAEREQKILAEKEPVKKTVQDLRSLLSKVEGFILDKSA